jgi:hypothetical protein
MQEKWCLQQQPADERCCAIEEISATEAFLYVGIRMEPFGLKLVICNLHAPTHA